MEGGDFDDFMDFEVESFFEDGAGEEAGDHDGVASPSSELPHVPVGDEDADAVPPVITNVQSYLPAVAPDAFPVVVAVLAQADLGVGVDLRDLSCATRNVEFMPNNKIVSATMRLHEPSAVVLVRTSGSLTIIGAASTSEARQAAELAARIIRKALNLSYEVFRFRVRSIMARFNVCSPVRLDQLANHQLEDAPHKGLGAIFCSYEPERFNGCIVRLVGRAAGNQWAVSVTVFVTGKVTLMGARSLQELRFAFDALVPILSRYTQPIPMSSVPS